MLPSPLCPIERVVLVVEIPFPGPSKALADNERVQSSCGRCANRRRRRVHTGESRRKDAQIRRTDFHFHLFPPNEDEVFTLRAAVAECLLDTNVLRADSLYSWLNT